MCQTVFVLAVHEGCLRVYLVTLMTHKCWLGLIEGFLVILMFIREVVMRDFSSGIKCCHCWKIKGLSLDCNVGDLIDDQQCYKLKGLTSGFEWSVVGQRVVIQGLGGIDKQWQIWVGYIMTFPKKWTKSDLIANAI